MRCQQRAVPRVLQWQKGFSYNFGINDYGCYLFFSHEHNLMMEPSQTQIKGRRKGTIEEERDGSFSLFSQHKKTHVRMRGSFFFFPLLLSVAENLEGKMWRKKFYLYFLFDGAKTRWKKVRPLSLSFTFLLVSLSLFLCLDKK